MRYRINEYKISSDKDNIKKIRKCKPPTEVRRVRRFLGIVQYYRIFIKGFTNIARPLYDLIRKDNEFEWIKA